MWKVSWFYEKVHNIANFGGYTAMLYQSSSIVSHDLATFRISPLPPLKELTRFVVTIVN